MKGGGFKDLKNRVNQLPQKLTQLVQEGRRNPVLGLYVLIGAVVLSSVVYFGSIIYQDVSGGGKRPASKTTVAQVEREPRRVESDAGKTEESGTKRREDAGGGPATPGEEAATGNSAGERVQQAAAEAESGGEAGATEAAPGGQQDAGKDRPAAEGELDTAGWQKHEFPDTSYIYFPPEWSYSELVAENHVLFGVRLRVPDKEASIRCYSRRRGAGENFAGSLKEKMASDGTMKIEEEKKTIHTLDVVQLNGVLTDKHMLITVFDHHRQKYVIISLIAAEPEYRVLRPYYDAILKSYRESEAFPKSDISVEDIEKRLQKSIEEDKKSLIGTVVTIRMVSGTRHKGLVVAEDDTSYTLESFRFGGRYSFTVKKDDIEEISH
jgi:hypothetical protein